MTVCMAPCPLVFDLDGTLIDSAPDIHACVNTVLRAGGIRPLTLDQVRSFIGGGVEVLWQRVIRATGADPAQQRDMMAAFMTRYHSATARTRLFPGVEDALGVLADRGHPLGLCTNKPMEPTRAVLDHFGLTALFSHVIAGDSLPEKKPDPAPLRAAFAGLGADPVSPRGLYIGDSEFDARCAEAVPVPLLIYTRGYRLTPLENLPYRAAFDDFSELPALVENQAIA